MDRIRFVVFVVLLGLVLLLVPLVLWASAPPSGAYAADLPTAIEPAALAPPAPEPAFDVEVLQRPGMGHKIIVSAEDAEIRQILLKAGAQELADYKSFWLLLADDIVLGSLTAEQWTRIQVRDDFNVIALKTSPFDTTVGEPAIPAELRLKVIVGKQLHLVQFVGPIKDAWLDELKAVGDVEIITYVPQNAYLVWADSDAISRIADLSQKRPFLQWHSPFHPLYKLQPDLLKMVKEVKPAWAEVDVTIQVVQHKGADATLEEIRGLASKVLKPAHPVLKYFNVTVRIPTSEFQRVAQMADVVAVETWTPPTLLDERQDQIVAGNLNVAGTEPVGPGYLAWLAGLGFSTTPDDYPIVDVTDDGFDTGNAAAPAHDDFYELGNNANPSRVEYAVDATADNDPHGLDGHGNINVAIVGGYNDTETGFPNEDAAGYQFGLGVNPYGRMASSRIFNDAGNFDLTNVGNSLTTLVSQSYQLGARITNNSWGCGWLGGCCGDYDNEAQEYDALVRDARPGLAGNQEMIIIVAAGNDRVHGHCIGSPSTAKNVITVGASENFRATGDADGCGEGDTDADNVQDIAGFSSFGPTDDGRVKPDIVAPGTHIQGAASQDANYTGYGVCGGPDNAVRPNPPNEDAYYPPDNVNDGHPGGTPPAQTLYTWSSGTSHSTPAVSGGAALLYRFYQDNFCALPSPAMTKAYLTNSSSYLTGTHANDTLPSNNQGMGLMDLGMAFDGARCTGAAHRMVFDQITIFDNTGEQFTVDGVVDDPSSPFRVSLAWTDAPAPVPAGGLNNNLDLEVTIGGNTYLGNHFVGGGSVTGGTADISNTLESVFLPAGTTGPFSVTVRASNIVDDGVPGVGDATDQDFALVLYNAALAVNSTADTGDGDPGDGICDTGTITVPTRICTLRAAIEEANANCGLDAISFNIPAATDPGCNAGTGVCTIRPTMLVPPIPHPLPIITDTVTINGYTQPGAITATATTDAILKIVLDGSSAGDGVNGFEFKTDCSTIRGLNIHGFRVTDATSDPPDFTHGNAIVVREGMTNTITGNFIGTDVTGTACVGNGGSGVLIGGYDSTADANRNTVGGTDPADRNVITCNGFQRDTSTPDPDDGTATGADGVAIRANHDVILGHLSVLTNTVVGNYIGTDVTGGVTLTAGVQTITFDSQTVVFTHTGNTGSGVRIAGGSFNTVGGTNAGERNIISGNELAGVRIEAVAFNESATLTSAAISNTVQGNYIGTDVNGTADLGNLDAGVYIVGFVDDADSNQIGGTTPAARNVIAGSGGSGVMILGGQASHNLVQGNYVGTDVNGTAAIPNDAGGINITDAMTNTIGGTVSGARNLVSGNGAYGISIVNSDKTWDPDLELFVGIGEASGNIIQGNYIGAEVSGTAALSNALSGVMIADAAGNTVGGASAGARNLISGNGQNGVLIVNAYPPGNTETDVVTAEGPGSVRGSDSATVTITDQPGALQVTKTVIPTSVATAGDPVTFTIRVTNTSAVDVNIKRLSDWLRGSLHGQGTCSVPQTLTAGGFYTCTFSAPVYGLGGNNTETDVVTASGTDANGNFVIGSDSATVIIGNPPPISVTKTANPTRMAPPDGTVNFMVMVKNISGSSVTINKMWDTKHGDLNLQGTCSVPQTLSNYGDSYSCTFSANVSGATGNTVEGNFIGTDVNGTAAVPNQGAGVVITTAPDNAIGGATAAQGNVISGNAREGVVILGTDATGNSLRHNLIGTQADGTSALGNGLHGVSLAGDPSDNAIGEGSVGNTIAYNGGDGVVTFSGTGNQILDNSIFDNDELGIDLGDDNAVTSNDDDDPDAGANNLQNFPVLTSASVNANTTIEGVLNSIASTQFTIQFFANTACDPSGFGEGRMYLATDTTTTDGSGNATTSVTVAGDLTGQFITATATDPYSNTSEFSNCIEVPSAPALTINKQVRDLNGGDAKPGDVLRYTITYTNTGDAPATGVFIADTYSTYCVTRTNVTDGDFPSHSDSVGVLRWPATDGIVLAAGASGSVRYDCTLQDPFPNGNTDVINESSIDSDQTDPDCTGETPPEEDPTDGCDQEQVTVTAAPVLTIDKECTPATGNSPGDTVHCVIQYANTGDADATGVTIMDDYDQSKGSVSGMTSSAHFAVGVDNADTISWGPSPLAVGESGQVEYDYTLAGADAFPYGTTPVTNTATIDCSETGPVQDTETIQVQDTTTPVLTINKQVQDLNGGLAEPGDVLQYTINYANTGNAQATGVFITDDYSDLCATISGVTTDGNFTTFSDAAGVLRWPDTGGITLAALASGSVSFDCTLQASFAAGTIRVTNTSTIDSDETDPEQDTATLSTVTCFDFNGNGEVDIGDVQAVATRWRMTESDPSWDARYDVDGDGVITVVDIVLVAAQWGQTCP